MTRQPHACTPHAGEARPTLNIVYYDPFDPGEEAYVKRRWCELFGKGPERIAVFYEGMRQWRLGPMIQPFYEAADSAHYPDTVQAAVSAGLTSYGCAVIRNLQREYAAAMQARGEGGA